MKRPHLKEIELLADGIYIHWDDGHRSYYNHRYLRSQCGCALCVSETTGQHIVLLGDISSDTVAVDWIPIGNYAVQFLWSDAHDAGAYPFSLLRGLCQCDQCSG